MPLKQRVIASKSIAGPVHYEKYMRTKKAHILIAAFLGAYILHLFFSFAEDVRGYGPTKESADAIVVLTGGLNRADEGLRLLREGRAGVLILSGVHADAGADSIFLNRINDSERARIVLDKASSSTYENAVEVKKLVNERGYGSIILLTSAYHMKRADFVFRRIMPPELRMETHSVLTPNYDKERWWAGGSLFVLVPEFLKYYWYAASLALAW